jgi:hypothetical protein
MTPTMEVKGSSREIGVKAVLTRDGGEAALPAKVRK